MSSLDGSMDALPVPERINAESESILQAKCSSLQNQLASLRLQQQKRKDQQKKEKEEIKASFNTMKAYIDQLESEYSQLAKVVKKQKRQTSEDREDSDSEALKKKVNALELENKQLKNREKDLNSKCKNLEGQLSNMKSLETSLRGQVEEYEKIVDLIPVNAPKRRTDASVQVLADISTASSRADTVEESSIGYGDDDVKDDLFGLVVDHTPVTPKATPKGSVATQSLKQEDDTVVGHADKADVASDFGEEDDLADEDSAVGGGQSLGPRGLSQLSVSTGLPLDVIDETNNLVDHVPLRTSNTSRRKTDVSTAVLLDSASASSEVEDPTEEHAIFGKVVDHTPFTPKPSRTKNNSASQVSSNSKQEDDTVVAHVEPTELDSYSNYVVELNDEESTLGGGPSVGPKGSSQISVGGISFRLDVIEEKKLVDHVPSLSASANRRDLTKSRTDASTMALADTTSVSSRVDDTVIDGEDDFRFGQIIDKTPSIAPLSARSIATDVATQNSGLYSGDLMDYGYQDTFTDIAGGVSTIDDRDWEEREVSESDRKLLDTPHLVDHVPKSRRRIRTDISMRVAVDPSEDMMSQVDTIAEEEEKDFGPVIDHVPPSSARSVSGLSQAASTFVGADTRADDDDDISTIQGDNTTIGAGGASTVGDGGWVDPDEGEEVAKQIEENHLVDHVPKRPGPVPVDASVRVAIDTNDAMSQVDTIAEDEEMDFGNIIDHVPMPSSTRSVGGFSTGDSMMPLGADTRVDDDSTAIGESTAGGSLGEDRASELDPSHSEVGQTEESILVDKVPQQTFPKLDDASIIVQADPVEIVSVAVDDDENRDIQFGNIVDHTPVLESKIPPSRQISMLTTATDLAADMRADDDMDTSYFSISTRGIDEEEKEASVSNSPGDGITGDLDPEPTKPGSAVVVETVSFDSDESNDITLEESKVVDLPTSVGENPFDTVNLDSAHNSASDLGEEMQQYIAELARKQNAGDSGFLC